MVYTYHMQHHGVPAGGAASLQKFFVIRSTASLSFALLLQRPDPEKQFEYFTLVEIGIAYIYHLFPDKQGFQKVRFLKIAFILTFLTLKDQVPHYYP